MEKEYRTFCEELAYQRAAQKIKRKEILVVVLVFLLAMSITAFLTGC
jgi:hypothetical protein